LQEAQGIIEQRSSSDEDDESVAEYDSEELD
jgi:hypothetical protein